MSESNANSKEGTGELPVSSLAEKLALANKPKPIKEFFKATGTASKREPTEDQKDWLDIL